VSDKESAKLSLSQTDKYRVVLNLFSRATSCSYVNAVLARLGFPKIQMIKSNTGSFYLYESCEFCLYDDNASFSFLDRDIRDDKWPRLLN
jgi:hypothetical protein